MPRPVWFFSFCVFALSAIDPALAQRKVDVPASDAEVLMRSVFTQNSSLRGEALQRIEERGKTDMVAGLIRFLRYSYDIAAVVETLKKLTGADPGPNWEDWMIWQEAHPEIKPSRGMTGSSPTAWRRSTRISACSCGAAST